MRVFAFLLVVLWAAAAHAQITLDSAGLGSESDGSVTWTHTTTDDSPQAYVVGCQDITTSVTTTGVTVGGVAMTQVQTDIDGVEGGSSLSLWVLVASVPTGDPSIVASALNGVTTRCDSYALVSATSTAIEVIDSDLIDSASDDNPQVVLSHGGRDAYDIAKVISGQPDCASVAPLTNFNETACNDIGNQTGFILDIITTSTSDQTIGYTATADNVGLIAVSLAEVVGAASTACKNLALIGVGGACAE